MASFNLVFEGGGVRGIGLVGALAALETHSIEPKDVAGASAGAIVAALYAAGYTSENLKKLLETDFDSLLDPPWPMTGFLRMTTKYGYYKGHKFYRWLRDLLEQKKVVYFKDIRERDLKVIASDLTNRRVLVFDKSRYPELEVAEAVRMSIGIPFFFSGVCLWSSIGR